MNQLKNVALIGNSLPRRCGIATFTTDLQQAVSKSAARVGTAVFAMTDHGHVYDYPPEVRLSIQLSERVPVLTPRALTFSQGSLHRGAAPRSR